MEYYIKNSVNDITYMSELTLDIFSDYFLTENVKG